MRPSPALPIPTTSSVARRGGRERAGAVGRRSRVLGRARLRRAARRRSRREPRRGGAGAVGPSRRARRRSGVVVPAPATTASWCNISSTPPSRPIAAARASIRRSRNSGAPPTCGCTTDRVGFNVPERAGCKFRGPDLHWDCSVKTPIPFGTQGILYLTDTPPEQGAFTLVPGFQRWGEDWLKQLAAGRASARAGSARARLASRSAGAPAIWSSGTRPCRTAPAPTAARSRAWCSTSICFRRGGRSRRSGFERAGAQRRRASSGR